MSRIGNRIISVPEKVTVEVLGNTVKVVGPKGELSTEINKNIAVQIKDNELTVTRKNDNFKNFHGTANALIQNMIIGVTEGYKKDLEIIGVGYRFNVKGDKLGIQAGFSHPIELAIPKILTVTQVSNTEISVNGISKQAVGEFAASIRKIRPPEPYKGKGIRIKGEHIIRKEGKKASK
jgi:large subunit ribosomal protein L6